jgi:hypothetical protein
MLCGLEGNSAAAVVFEVLVKMTTMLNRTHEDDQAFMVLVNNQVQRVTNELGKLERLLQAGMVDRAVLLEFRQAVDQIRKTSWNVEQSMTVKGQ